MKYGVERGLFRGRKTWLERVLVTGKGRSVEWEEVGIFHIFLVIRRASRMVVVDVLPFP